MFISRSPKVWFFLSLSAMFTLYLYFTNQWSPSQGVIKEQKKVLNVEEQKKVIAPTEITLHASREYAPDVWNDDRRKVNFSATYQLPQNLSVLAGNSGVGWASIAVGNFKVCYRGSAQGESDPYGSSFSAVIAKANTKSDCSVRDDSDREVPKEVILSRKTPLKLSIEGGGCSQQENTCVFTEVEAVLRKVRD